ncbi:GATOR complex protein MIOS [Agrilus planipennis]|uniref:GATOR complex protein MIOS n=1 Tax=Agrilus planipennis TaxID=224129 RepID=A0A1W4XSV9_AGRPL|nr:GATOR complex protein MIOS [Agrilus planipennis]
MSAKLEIEWTQIANKFITWGSEICLYETEFLKDKTIPCMKISNNLAAFLLTTNPNYHYIKCLDIYPKSNDILLAVGQGNGKVSLVTFGPSQFDSQGLPGKEFVPRHPRQCNTVAWNRIDSNLVAVGLDKYRSDHSVLLWDIVKCPFSPDSNGALKPSVSSMTTSTEVSKPVAEFGMSDMTASLAWFNTNSKTLAVGMNLKNIRIVDFRDSVKVVTSTPTKAVFGLCMEPNLDRHLASYCDNQVCIWDVRNFEKPLVTLTYPKPTLKIGWCPTRHNLLASLQRDSSLINLYDIQQTIVGNEEVEPSILERVVIPNYSQNITSFSWHPTEENRLLSITLTGTISDYIVYDRITLNWAPNSNVVWTFGRKTMKILNENSSLYDPLKDISHKIKQRALDGYGLKEELSKNGDMVDDVLIKNAWKWLQLSGKLSDEGILRGYNSRHPGVRTVLKIDGVNVKSDTISISWADLGNSSCHSSAKIYRHEDRDKALYLCGWKFDKDNTLSKLLDRLEKEHAFSRAAAIAVFNLKIKQALEILSRGAESSFEHSNLNIVAMALAGFSDDKNSVWKQISAGTRAQIGDPYLRAMFAFLTAENYNYDAVLNEDGMLVEDRVAFACTFLSDGKLLDYLKALAMELTEEGNLDGLLLTGNNSDGMQLLQQYLDVTGDIQTTALIVVKAFPIESYTEKSKEWVTSYRNLLDVWQLWNERAHFDIMLNSYKPTEKPPQQVYVSCNFCGKSISAYMQGLNRGRGPFSRMGSTANKLKMSSCPNCRKPLPRCAICLMHMGTTMGKHINGDVDSNKLVEFSHWFTWCQSCRHGGHASHMIHWFRNHSECPVTPCSCKCFAIDSWSNEDV